MAPLTALSPNSPNSKMRGWPRLSFGGFKIGKMTVMCQVCDKFFSKQSNLNRHRKEVHGLEAINSVSYDNLVWNYKCLETNCNHSYQRSEGLIQHLQQVHNILFEEIEEIVFSNKSGKLTKTVKKMFLI